jgi:hypothetical protein
MIVQEKDVQQNPRGMVIAGWILSAIPALMLLSGTYFALSGAPMVTEGMAHNGFPLSLVKTIGLIELTCSVLYLIPATAFYGAILISAYMGGAVVTHLRIGESQWFVGVVFAIIAWAGLAMRDSRFRAFLTGR